MNNKLSDEDIKLFRWLVDDEKCKYPHIASKSEVMLKERVLLELLEYREAESKPVAVVETSDYFTVSQLTGTEPRRKAVRELYEGGLVIGQKLYASPVLSQPVPDELPEPQDSCAGYYRDGWNDCRAVLLSASPVLGQTPNDDDKKDAERWRFIRKFLAVEDIDGSLDGEAMHVLCIKESAFEAAMIGFPNDVSIETAIDAALEADK